MRHILVGITGRTERDWKSKLKEIEKFKIREVALFLEMFLPAQRKKIYAALLASGIRKIPLVHIRNDMKHWELKLLADNFGTSYFTIHENSFRYLAKWKGFHTLLYLEMNADNIVSDSVQMGKIGGFCVDLAHFKKAEERCSKDFKFVMRRSHVRRYFACNHVNGYSYKKNTDLHTIKSLKEFDYLKTLPKFLFGEYVAIETFNCIPEQLTFQNYLKKLLK